MKKSTGSANLHEQFPILGEGFYANHAAIAPWPAATSRAVEEFAVENSQTGPRYYAAWLKRERLLRAQLAGLLNADSADDIALVKNTSEAISFTAAGVDWRQGDNIVTPAAEFPSNALPWAALSARGVGIREVDIRQHHDPETALLNRVDARTRVLTASSVQWTDGFRLDLEKLGKGLNHSKTLFFVDAIQQLGALPLDVRRANIDILAADAHKWLLGPEGIAVFYCRQSARERLQLSQFGWRMVDDPYDFDRLAWQPSETARRFEPGSPNMLGQAALHASLAELLDQGMSDIGRKVLENSTEMIRQLESMPGVSVVSRTDPARLSGIVSFRADQTDQREVFKRLKKRGVITALRHRCIRLSPHFYQHGIPIQTLMDVVESALK